MRSVAFCLLLVSACLAMLSGCTFYVGGSDAGTREGKKAAVQFAPVAEHNA